MVASQPGYRTVGGGRARPEASRNGKKRDVEEPKKRGAAASKQPKVATSERAPGAEAPEEQELVREAAHNLVRLCQASGAHELARLLVRTFNSV